MKRERLCKAIAAKVQKQGNIQQKAYISIFTFPAETFGAAISPAARPRGWRIPTKKRSTARLLSAFDIPAWSAPTRNLSMLTEFPFNCSITGWLVMLYAYRWLCLFCGAVIVLLISSRMKRIEVAYIAASGVMLLPSLLYAYVGIEVFWPLALILPVEAMPLLILANGAITQFLTCSAALTVIAGLAIGWLFISANKLKSK